MYTHILLPTDGSKLSEEAIRSGIALAKIHGARVTGLYVMPVATGGDIWDMWTPEDSEEARRFRTKFEERLKCAAGEHLSVIERAAKEAGVSCECITAKGPSASEEIIRVAEERGCDLIFMASHGRTGIKGILLGSVTRSVLAHAKVPVSVHR